jgi:Domain of unknown function (DUF4276)
VKFILFVEGGTERKVLREFLKRWLDPQLRQPIGIDIVEFEGWSDYDNSIKRKVELNMSGRKGQDALGGLGLIDLYGPTFYPKNIAEASERLAWGRDYFEKKVGHPQFRQYFAVHETEAWLLSEAKVLPAPVARALPGKCANPEIVNFDEPPSKLLSRLYWERLRRKYKKVVDGSALFRQIDPQVAYSKCPSLVMLLDDMLALAREAGL